MSASLEARVDPARAATEGTQLIIGPELLKDLGS